MHATCCVAHLSLHHGELFHAVACEKRDKLCLPQAYVISSNAKRVQSEALYAIRSLVPFELGGTRVG